MHFQRVSATVVGDVLEIRFRELGLTQDQPVTVQGFAKATAYWRCQGRTVVIIEELAASGEFAGGPDGEASGCLRITPPEPTWEAAEPGEAVLLSVIYSEVQVTDQTNYRFLDIPGTFGPTAVEPALPMRLQVSLTWNPPKLTPVGPAQIAQRPAST